MILFLLLSILLVVAAALDQRLLATHGGRVRPTTPAGHRHAILQRTILAGCAFGLLACLCFAPDAVVRWVGSGSLLAMAGMVIDAQCLLSDAQALTATGVSTNTYDTGAAANALDIGEPMAICYIVDVAADTASGDETYQINVIQSANADLSAADVLITTNTTFMPRGFFTAGKKFFLPIPPGAKTKRYIGTSYTLGGTTPSITITAFIQPLSMIQNDYINVSGLTISS